MYLARKIGGLRHQHYILRESYLNDGIFCSRDLVDLGRDPGRFLVSRGETSFHLDEELLGRLQDQGVAVVYSELEELFLPFLDPYIRNRLQPFWDRHKYRHWQPASESLRQRALHETHAMDRRRLLFLRLGRTGTDMGEKTAALYTVLLDKSRDEIEQLILVQEQALPPREYQQYLFAIFDLQRFFPESYARSIPQALNRDRLDTLLVEEICRLAADPIFWRGFPRTDCLPQYLVRYLLMYFDAAPEEPTAWTRSRRSSHSQRFYRTRYADTGRVSRQQAVTIFGISPEQLALLSTKELTRLYHRKAHELHPDKGGETEQFIRLTAAYEELLSTLP